MKLKINSVKKKKRISSRNLNVRKSNSKLSSLKDFKSNYINNIPLKNHRKRTKSRRNSSLHKNILIRKSINKIKTNIYNRKNYYSHLDKNKFVLPELKKEYKDDYEKHLNSFKSIFGDGGKDINLNYKQFKIFFNQIGIVDKMDENWEFEKNEDEIICKLFFDILGSDLINFEFLKLVLILVHQIKSKNTNFNFFNKKKEKKEYEILSSNNYLQKKIVFKKIDFTLEKKKKKIHKKDNKIIQNVNNNKNWDLIRQNLLVNSHKSVTNENFNESEKNLFDLTLNFKSNNKNFLKKPIAKKKKEKVLFFAQVNFGDKKEKIYIRENDDIKMVAFEFKKKII